MIISHKRKLLQKMKHLKKLNEPVFLKIDSLDLLQNWKNLFWFDLCDNYVNLKCLMLIQGPFNKDSTIFISCSWGSENSKT